MLRTISLISYFKLNIEKCVMKLMFVFEFNHLCIQKKHELLQCLKISNISESIVMITFTQNNYDYQSNYV